MTPEQNPQLCLHRDPSQLRIGKNWDFTYLPWHAQVTGVGAAGIASGGVFRGGQSPPASAAGWAGPGTDREGLRECWHREGPATPIGPRSDSVWGWWVLLCGKAKAPSHPRPGGRCVTCPPCADSQPGFPNHEFTGGRRLMTSRGLQDLKNVASAQIQNQGGETSSAMGNRSFGGLSGTPFTCQPPAWAAELPPA